MEKTLFWIPRVLAILFISFISLFALDAFAPDYSLGEQIIGFLIHLVPTYILALVLIISWKNEILGGLLFILLAIIMFVYFHNPLWVNLILTFPPFLVGVLFITHDYLKKRR